MVTFNLVVALQWVGVVVCVLAALVLGMATGVQMFGSLFSRNTKFDWRDWVFPALAVILIVAAIVVMPVTFVFQ